MAAYYNENNEPIASWLRELIREGLIDDGEVDTRSVVDVRPNDLRGFTQCHFFAGIGGWSYALRLAGWDDARSVWTGSCPCQPFSSTGAREGRSDERHLWPAWFDLIRECRPPVVFGEQVESAIAHGWLDGVCDDLEREGYAVGAACLPAAGVGAFIVRPRVWFVAHTVEGRCPIERETRLHVDRASRYDAAGRRTDGDWDGVEWIPCSDGKNRPIEPGTFPLADGVPARMVRLRGYGNAIVPRLASEFIQAYCDVS